MNKYNYSTAYDVCLLSAKCMTLPRFREVVRTKEWRVRDYHWENTNKLLSPETGFIGCKTGITDAAGPCFSGCYEGQEGERLLVVVLNSRSMEQRWVEVPQMVEWVIKRRKG